MAGIIIGAIMTVVGGILTAWGHSQQQTFEYQFCKAWGDTEDIIGIDIAFYAGLVLLIIGIILLLIGLVKKFSSAKPVSAKPFLSDGVSAAPNYQAAQKEKFRCAKCGALMSAGMAFCPDCGCQEKVPEGPVGQPAPAAPVFCGRCGAQGVPGEAFCHQCGNKLL